jgi:hypothetical protein
MTLQVGASYYYRVITQKLQLDFVSPLSRLNILSFEKSTDITPDFSAGENESPS